jgi:hypothetical protein
MDRKQVAKWMMGFKVFFESAFSVLTLLQGQTEKMINFSLAQITFLPKVKIRRYSPNGSMPAQRAESFSRK